jgi:hypothetical protein
VEGSVRNQPVTVKQNPGTLSRTPRFHIHRVLVGVVDTALSHTEPYNPMFLRILQESKKEEERKAAAAVGNPGVLGVLGFWRTFGVSA